MIIGISGKIGAGKDELGLIIQYLTDVYAVGDKLSYEAWLEEKAEIEERNSNYVSHASLFEIKKFAGKLKQVAAVLLGCNEADFENREFKNKELGEEWWYYKLENTLLPRNYYPNIEDNQMCEDRYLVKPTPRLFLQLLGTEAGRQILHPNIWVNALMIDYKHMWNDPDPIEGNDYKLTYQKDYPESGTSLIQYGEGSEAEVFTSEIIEDNWLITDMRFPNEAKAVKDKGGITIRINRPGYGTSMKALAEAHASETALDGYEFDYVIDNSGSVEDLVEKMREILTKKGINYDKSEYKRHIIL